jgi:hypothetical protein
VNFKNSANDGLHGLFKALRRGRLLGGCSVGELCARGRRCVGGCVVRDLDAEARDLRRCWAGIAMEMMESSYCHFLLLQPSIIFLSNK